MEGEVKKLVLPDWYYVTPEARAALKVINGLRSCGFMPVVLIKGAPGTGKTMFGEGLANANNADYIYYLAHAWTTDEDIFQTVDPAKVAGAVAGKNEPDEAYAPGALLKAALSAQKKLTVLVIDEIDKATSKVDTLLYDMFQNYRAWTSDGFIVFPPQNLVVILTSNEMRKLSEPLERRCYRVEFKTLPAKVEVSVLKERTGASKALCAKIVRAMNAIRKSGETTPTLYEGMQLINVLVEMFASGEKVAVEDVENVIKGWLVKTDRDLEVIDTKALAKDIVGTITSTMPHLAQKGQKG